MNANNICHQGTVIKTSEDCVYVSIESKSACASCQAKNMCNLSDLQEKIIEVNMPDMKKYKSGDHVKVSMKRSLGTKALWLGYIIPFFIVMISLFLFSYLTKNELHAGLISLLLLFPYYLVLYAMRHRLKKTFTFEIE